MGSLPTGQFLDHLTLGSLHRLQITLEIETIVPLEMVGLLQETVMPFHLKEVQQHQVLHVIPDKLMLISTEVLIHEIP